MCRAQWFLATAALLFPMAAMAQGAKEIPSAEIIAKTREARDLASIGLPKEYVVSGDTKFNSWALTADRIVFKSGATLTFSDEALARRDEFFIIANEIVSEDQANPGKITWAREDGPGTAPPAAGQAPSGTHGQGDGAHGGAGSTGAIGNQGYPGRNAPSLTIFVRKVTGSGQLIDFKGQDGGAGGQGQAGGDGGVGHKGAPASSSAVDCRRGAGYGGNGGSGGNGGTGGTGGNGGVGGTVTLVSLPDNLSPLSKLYRTEISGGKGGPGGSGGSGGAGGPGGSQGAKSLPYCQDEPGRKGKPGAVGNSGPIGTKGVDGIAGDFLVTGLTQEQFDKMMTGGGN